MDESMEIRDTAEQSLGSKVFLVFVTNTKGIHVRPKNVRSKNETYISMQVSFILLTFFHS